MIKMTRVFEFNVRPDLDWVGTRFEPKERKDRFGILEPGERRCFREQFVLNNMLGSIQFPPSWGKRWVRVTVETADEKKATSGRPGNMWREAAHRTKGKEATNDHQPVA